MRKLFYVVFISDPVLRGCIDGIRFICNPLARESAHVTVRGPYKGSIRVERWEKYNAKIRETSVRIREIGTFENGPQNTVFLRCEAEELRLVWKKFTYRDFNPHITLYDGDSRHFLNDLKILLAQFKFDFSFKAGNLTPLASQKGQGKTSLLKNLNRDFIDMVFTDSFALDNTSEMSHSVKLEHVERACHFMCDRGFAVKRISKPSSRALHPDRPSQISLHSGV